MEYLNPARLRAVEEPEQETEEPQHWYKVRFGTKEVAPVVNPDFPYVAAGLDATQVFYTALIRTGSVDDAWRTILAVFKSPVMLRIEVDCKPEFEQDDAMMGAAVRGVVAAQKRRGLLSSIFCFWK